MFDLSYKGNAANAFYKPIKEKVLSKDLFDKIYFISSTEATSSSGVYISLENGYARHYSKYQNGRVVPICRF